MRRDENGLDFCFLKEKVHYEAPTFDRLDGEMAVFLEWFENGSAIVKAAIAHLRFITTVRANKSG